MKRTVQNVQFSVGCESVSTEIDNQWADENEESTAEHAETGEQYSAQTNRTKKGVMSWMQKHARAIALALAMSMPASSFVEGAKKTAAPAPQKEHAAVRYNPKTKKMELVTEEMKKKEHIEYLMRFFKRRLDNPNTPLSDEERARIRKGLEDGSIDPETLEVPAPLTEAQTEEPMQRPEPLQENKEAVKKDTKAIRHIERDKEHQIWIIDYQPAEKSGEGLRGPSAYPVEGLEADLVTDEVTYNVERWGEHFRLEKLIPFVQNIGEVCNLEMRVSITTDGISEKESDMDVAVITSGRNQALWIKINAKTLKNKGSIHIRADQYITMPQTRSNVIAGLQTNPYFLQLAAVRQQVHNSGQNELANGNVFATCYPRACAVEQLSNNAAATIVGEWKGFRHAWNVSGGNLIFDSAAGDYIGPENMDFIPTSSGHMFTLPDEVMKGEKQRVLDIGKGQNGKYIYSGGRMGRTHREFSTTKYGSRQAELMQAQRKIPDSVKKLLEQVRAEREAINRQRIAVKN